MSLPAVIAFAAGLLAPQEPYRRPPDPIPAIVLAEEAPSITLCPDQRQRDKASKLRVSTGGSAQLSGAESAAPKEGRV